MDINLLIECVLAGLFAFIVAYLMYYKAKKKKQFEASYGTPGSNLKQNYLYFFSQFFKKSKLLRNRYSKIYVQKQNLMPSESITVEFEATKEFLKQIAFGIIGSIFFIAVSGFDLFFLLAGLLLVYLLLDHMSGAATEKTDEKLLKQLRDVITQTIANYNKLQTDPADAIRLTLEKLPSPINIHMNIIYKAITSVKIREACDDYAMKAPNSYFRIFIATCQSIQEYGDKRVENDQSVFIRDLSLLNDAISHELTVRKENNDRFRHFSFIIIAPAAFIKPMQWWNEANLPETASYFSSMAGSLTMAGIFALIIVLYTYVQSLRTKREAQIKEDSVFLRLSRTEPLAKLFKAYNKVNYTKSLRRNDDLLTIKDRTGVNAFYTKKLVYALVAFVVTMLLMSASVIRERASKFSQFGDYYASQFSVSDSYKEAMVELSTQVAKEGLESGKTNEELEPVIQQALRENGISNSSYTTVMTSEILKIMDEYRSSTFKWYYMLVSLAVAVVAFFIPNIMLKSQIKTATMEQIDEVTRFQTLALILEYVDGCTLEEVLEWMLRFSYIFKYRIEKCLIDLPHGQKQALEEMQESPSTLFNAFVDTLINIDNVGIQQAFVTVKGDREFYETMRNQEEEVRSKSNAQKASIASLVSIVGVVVAQMIMPLAISVLQMQETLNAAMQGSIG